MKNPTIKGIINFLGGLWEKSPQPTPRPAIPIGPPPKTRGEWFARGYDKAFPEATKYIPTPTATPQRAVLSATPTPAQIINEVIFNRPDPEFIKKTISEGYDKYGQRTAREGTLYANQFVPQMTEATQRHPLFAANPYLLPAISILETSGGRNITRPNNLLNWGINYPGNNEAFAQMTAEEVLKRAIEGLGERSPYYKKFRHGKPLTDEELMELAKIYEPANRSYGPNLISTIQSFR